MRFGLDVAQHHLTWPELLERVRFAEQAGFDGAWVFDHFKAMYGDPNGPCLEGWTLLAALAASTTRIRLGTRVTGMTYRYPSILATEAVTIDHVSSGRLELAVGAAWFEEEHRELGIGFPGVKERAKRLEEGITVMRALMTRDAESFQGRHYHLDRATYHPRPVQRPHPPIWIGASGERLMLPIVGRQADMWDSLGGPQEISRKGLIVDEAARRAGRDPASIGRSASLSLSTSLDGVLEQVERFESVGVSYLVVGWPSEGRGLVEQFAARAVSRVSAA